MNIDAMSEDEEEEREDSYSPLTYQIGKGLKVGELREKMRIRGINDKGPKLTLLNRIKYFSFAKKRRFNEIEDNQLLHSNVTKNTNTNKEPPQKKRKIQSKHSTISKMQNEDEPQTSTDNKFGSKTIHHLSNDCVQEILSYLLDFGILLVCKQWNKLSKRNTRFVLERNKKSIENYSSYFDPEECIKGFETTYLFYRLL